ncbi:Autoinducer 2 sensor kinase/phosphatase LuxQ [Thiorhodovibrio winogradskyi]|uniref:histidine kinase n=2 Tax=Thiorhodovibrio winogradskyi TaxID=77007 RepID=A0ABZ0S8Z3_9GAMM
MPCIKRLLLIAMSLGLANPGAASLQMSVSSPSRLTDQERAWLAAGHRVRVRISDYPPYMMREPQPAGLAVDYLDHIAQQFGLDIQYVPATMTFGAAVTDVEGPRRHYDVLPTFTRTPEREKHFAITDDYLNAPWVIFTRQDSPYLIGLESLAGKTIAAEQGFWIVAEMKRDIPRISILEVPLALDALTAVATGQADAYVGNLAVGAFLVKEHRLRNLMVAAPTHFGINTQAMAVRRDWPELASLINKGIAAMTADDRNIILGKWIRIEMRPQKDYRLAYSILAAAALAVIAFFFWNRRLAREIAFRRRVESELKQKKAALQELNATLERRLQAAVQDRTRVLSEATARAQESSQSKSAFLSAVSHELRSPLHDILGYARLLAHRIPPQARDQLNIIHDSGNQLLRLINDILEYSRGEEKPIVLEPGPVSLARLARNLAAAYQPLATRTNNGFIVERDAEGPDWVIADELRLTQILRNLLDNAFKFTQDGLIELVIEPVVRQGESLALEGMEADWMEADWMKTGGMEMDAAALVRFIVRDTGVGIPVSERQAIFQPYRRLERHRGVPGVGLGLAIARQLTTAMGGSIGLHVSSARHAGSTFHLLLPLPICTEVEQAADEEANILGYAGRRRTLLIADDQSTSREFLAECCRAWGFDVIEAVDGAHAIKGFRAIAGCVDAVLVDQYMPHLDGWGCLRALRSLEPGRHLPVILISAGPARKPDGYPEDLDFDQFVMKPLGESTLARLLGESLALEWEYAAEPPMLEEPEPEPDPLTLARFLTDEERGRMQAMVAMGQVVALLQWAEAMASRDLARELMWQAIARMCRAVDLPALKRLVAASADH